MERTAGALQEADEEFEQYQPGGLNADYQAFDDDDQCIAGYQHQPGARPRAGGSGESGYRLAQARVREREIRRQSKVAHP